MFAYSATVSAAPPPAPTESSAAPTKQIPSTRILKRNEAVRWALQTNPTLTTQREQHGIAAAGVVIAKTYPFNPFWQSFVLEANGPATAGVTNPVFIESTMRLDLELRGQGKHRRAAAVAALSRTDWDIAFQEATLAIGVIRGFDAVLYRQEKLRLLEDTVRLNESTAAQVARLVEQGKLRGADLLLARTEVETMRAQRGPGQVALSLARQNMLRLLGVVDDPFEAQGSLMVASVQLEKDLLVQEALDHRADLHARQQARCEAEARLRLERANRYGNPSFGPAYEYNETRVNFIGGWLVMPLPVFNTHRGEIQQREAERNRAGLELRQFEIQVRQDVEAALARLNQAHAWVDSYQNQVLPSLRKSLEGMEKLFAQGEPGVDVLRVIDVRRKLLNANDVFLDALFETCQAKADLAAALGDPALALNDGSPSIEATPAPAAHP